MRSQRIEFASSDNNDILEVEQMKPEVRAAQAVELNDAEKALFKMIGSQSPIQLNELKSQSGLSNKKWDKTIKGLTKNKLATVNKTDDGLFVEIAE